MVRIITIYEGVVFDKLPHLVKGDNNIELNFHVLQENGTSFDLTGFDIEFKAKYLTNFEDYLIQKDCVITEADKGYCKVVLDGNKLNDVGSFDCSLNLNLICSTCSSYDTVNKIPIDYLYIFNN